jgi:hypothetical protein
VGAAALRHPYAGAYLAALASLEARPRAAARRLLGYADAIYAAREEARESNETMAMDRARAIARASLGDSELKRLEAVGARLRDSDIAALAIGSTEA